MTIVEPLTINIPPTLSDTSTSNKTKTPSFGKPGPLHPPTPAHSSIYPSSRSMNIPSVALDSAQAQTQAQSRPQLPPPPRPPPLRSAYSASSSGPSSTSPLMFRTGTDPESAREKDFIMRDPWDTPRSSKFEDDKQLSGSQSQIDKEELTTKGRKRKRLAKACSACHKNKRRCDGFAPCSNCEFSNRPCLYVNAQGDAIPPPRTRDSSVTPGGKSSKDDAGAVLTTPGGHERKPSGESPWSRHDSFRDLNGDTRHRRPSIDIIHLVENDLALQMELVDIFFKRCPPLSMMLHSPTFHYRLYLGQVSPILLDAIYALAARLCENPTLVSSFLPDHPAWLRGERFARRAHSAAERMIDIRRSWTNEDHRMNSGTWQETELAQASYLLSVYFTCLRQPRLGLFYLESGLDILRPVSSAYISPPATHLGLSPIEYATLGEMRSRTFWLLISHELSAVANGKPRSFYETDIGNIPLPGSELLWAKCGGSASGGREPGRRDGLIAGSGNWAGEEGESGELGHVIRIMYIFADIMTLATDTKHSESRSTIGGRLESSLKSWAMSLPRQLQFDEHNLTSAVIKLSSPIVEVKNSGWLYAYMHAVAECGMFYLQAAVAVAQQHNSGSGSGSGSGSSDGVFTAQRQSQAVDNLTVIMDSIGFRGREGSAFIFPLIVITNWQEHLRLSNLVLPGVGIQQQQLENKLNEWWNEIKCEWGMEKQELLQRGFHSLPPGGPLVAQSQTPRYQSTQIHTQTQTQGLGLYQSQTQSQTQSQISPLNSMIIGSGGGGETISPTSTMSMSMSISTPRYSQSQSQSHREQGHRWSTSSSSIQTQTQLPPLRPRATTITSTSASKTSFPSPPLLKTRLPSFSSSSSSFSVERIRDRDRDREKELTLPPLISMREVNTSPRFHPYLHKLSPRLNWERDRQSGQGGQGQLMGIAALVSAAEKQRERERESMEAA